MRFGGEILLRSFGAALLHTPQKPDLSGMINIVKRDAHDVVCEDPFFSGPAMLQFGRVNLCHGRAQKAMFVLEQ